MNDYFRRKRKIIFLFSSLLKKKSRLRKIIRPSKINILAVVILILCMRLFFYTFFENNALAQKKNFTQDDKCILLDPLKNIQKNTPNFSQKVSQFCQNYGSKNKSLKEITKRKKEYGNLVKGHPMEIMVPAMSL